MSIYMGFCSAGVCIMGVSICSRMQRAQCRWSRPEHISHASAWMVMAPVLAATLLIIGIVEGACTAQYIPLS